jgi:dTDP-glucose 4,6-dehydratase
MMKRLKKAIVTGADGFIGSHLVERLVRSGYDVKAFVLYNSFNSWGWLDILDDKIKKSIEVISGDVRDPICIRNALEGCDIAFHLAALVSVPYSYHAPQSFIDTNVKGTLNLVQAARDLNLTKIIHTSTSEVYGTALYCPIDESHPLQPQSPYSASKMSGDHVALSFFHAFETPVAVIRPFNTYGPRQSARAVIPTIITQVISGSSEIRLGSLLPTRDFNYISDTVEGFMAVAESEKTVGQVVNVGGSCEVSIQRLAEILLEHSNSSAKISTDIQRLRPQSSEVQRLSCDNSKARELTGWEPAHAGEQGLRRGLRTTLEWFSQPNTLSLYKADRYNV